MMINKYIWYFISGKCEDHLFSADLTPTDTDGVGSFV